MKQLNEIKRMQELAGIVDEVDLSPNLDQKATIIGSTIGYNIVKLIDSKIDDNLASEITSSPEVFFDFYEKVLDAVLNKVYEKYGDSFNTKAGAAPDEY